MKRAKMITTPMKLDPTAACWNCQWYRIQFSKLEPDMTFPYCGYQTYRYNTSKANALVNPDGICDQYEKSQNNNTSN